MSDRFQFPEAILRDHTAALGKTGAGKTSTTKLLVEQVVDASFRVCILDSIKSDWWGITSSADGKAPGMPFRILGGPHGHVPLPASAGAAIGELVGTGKLPLSIIDMADFGPGGLQRFFVDFAPALLKSNRGVVFLVIEEAHEFAPKERAGIEKENLALHWAKKLATAGRSRGIRLVVATQRVQALHNAVLGSCETVIAHRLTTPADQEPAVKWLKANADKRTAEEVAGSLASLPTGTGWLCSGAAQIFEKVSFPKFRSYDNTATPERDGEELRVTTAAVDHAELRAIIGDAVKQAEANDPVALHKQIASLQAELRKKPQPAGVDPGRIEKAEREGYQRGDAEATARLRQITLQINESLGRVFDGLNQINSQIHGEIDNLSKIGDRFSDLIQSSTSEEGTVPNVPAAKAGLAPLPAQVPKRAVPAPVPTGNRSDLPVPQQRIIASLRFWRNVGDDEPTREQVAAVAGYTPSSGGFKNLLGKLSSAELVTYPSAGRVRLLGVAEHYVAEVDHDNARSMFFGTIGGPHRKVLEAIVDGNEYDRDAIAAATGYSVTSGGFKNILGKLRTLTAIDYPRQGVVVIADWVRELVA